jgi:hypothetical protein
MVVLIALAEPSSLSCRVVSCPCATWSPWRHRALAATSAIANAVLTDGQRTSIGGAVTRFPMARSSPHTDSFPPKPAVVSRFGVCRCCLAGSRFPVHAHLRIPTLESRLAGAAYMGKAGTAQSPTDPLLPSVSTLYCTSALWLRCGLVDCCEIIQDCRRALLLVSAASRHSSNLHATCSPQPPHLHHTTRSAEIAATSPSAV